jgi:hypothetical protein
VAHYVHKFAHYLDNGKDFTVFTDHTAVESALKGNTGKLLRWGLSLSPYVGRMRLKYMKGKQMPADFLSRHPEWTQDNTYLARHPEWADHMEHGSDDGKTYVLHLVPLSEAEETRAKSEWANMVTQASGDSDAWVCATEQYVLGEHGWKGVALAALQEECERNWRALQQRQDRHGATGRWASERFTLEEGVLMRLNPRNADAKELVLPVGLRPLVLQELHDGLLGGHVKDQRMEERLTGRYWWPNCEKEANEWARTCEVCQLHQKKYGLYRSLRPSEPFSITAIDLIGPLPATTGGNKYILTWIDYTTRWAEAVVIPDKSAATVARAYLEHIICRWGAPLRIVSDRGPEFVNKVFTELHKLMDTQQWPTTPHHPQADGMTERFNGTLLGMLARAVSYYQRDWDTVIPHCLFAYRSAVHSATKKMPFNLMTGTEPRFPTEGALTGRTR